MTKPQIQICDESLKKVKFGTSNGEIRDRLCNGHGQAREPHADRQVSTFKMEGNLPGGKRNLGSSIVAATTSLLHHGA